jgi:two-component system OmpR family sensor kinase
VKVPHLTSRQRLTLRIVLGLVVVWCVGGWLLIMSIERQLMGRIDDELREQAPTEATIMENLPRDVLERLSEDLRVTGDNDALLIYGLAGVTTALPSGPADQPDPLPDLEGFTIEQLRGRAGDPFTVGDVAGRSERYRAVTAPLQSGGVIVTARSLEQAEEVMRMLGKVLLVSFLTSIAIVITLVWLVGRWALRPLEDVIGTAQQIGAGTLDTRVEVSSSASDVGRLADAMNTMLGRLEDAFAAKERSEARMRQFVGDASHELRTPLAAVIGYAELYQEQMARTPEQVDRVMGRIVAEGTRMQSLVEDLLLLARLDEGRPLARDAVDLAALVEDSVSAIRVIDPSRTFALSSAGGDIEVIGDGVALRQIVDNLLSNVVAHTPPGTHAHVTLAVDGDVAVLTVTDDGPGMSDEHRARAFDRFWRAELARSRPGGSGLGLAIVAELVRAHGGSIDLDSAPGAGCTFTVRLPLAPSPAPSGPVPAPVSTG